MFQKIRADNEDVNVYEQYVNPQWVRLLDVLQMNVRYVRCRGVELHTSDNELILDFISGYCVHNIGHNHPRLIAALKEELDRAGPAMLQNHVSDVAGELAKSSAPAPEAASPRRFLPVPAAKALKRSSNSLACTPDAPAFSTPPAASMGSPAVRSRSCRTNFGGGVRAFAAGHGIGPVR